jgi:hypothetical protein
MRNEPQKAAIHDWKELLAQYDQFQAPGMKWIFRGLPKACYPLSTSLERALEAFGINLSEAATFEKSLMHLFRRQAQKYIIDLPPEKEFFTWLTLMQHYGTPTRLQDWTYSFFVAVFFAVERSKGDPSAVWCLDANWCAEQYHAILKAIDEPSNERLQKEDPYIREKRTFEDAIAREEPMLNVYPGNAFGLNERLIIQQGFFLVPCDVSQSFEDNLDALLGNDADYLKHFLKIEIDSDVELRTQILTHLYRMNITRATLFPGLQGFAESLRTLIASRNVLLSEHAGK